MGSRPAAAISMGEMQGHASPSAFSGATSWADAVDEHDDVLEAATSQCIMCVAVCPDSGMQFQGEPFCSQECVTGFVQLFGSICNDHTGSDGKLNVVALEQAVKQAVKDCDDDDNNSQERDSHAREDSTGEQ